MADKTAPDYKDTLFLPKTDFPMRAGLPKREPEWLARWQKIGLYERQREISEGRERWELHDGPPYANGNLHIGHALNKILKDVVVRSHQMLGYDSRYIPGWDCHGLPIEWKIEEQFRKKGKNKDEVPVNELRRLCREFAGEWIDTQKSEFKRLGVIGDWDNHYETMSFEAEAVIAEEFMKFMMNGTLYRGSKPVMWSPIEKTALAEAEVEYHDHQSHTIWVPFEIVSDAASDLKDARVVIWTTTPWTIPQNRAICYSETIAYSLYRVTDAPDDNWAKTGEHYVLADALAESMFSQARVDGYEKLREIPADELGMMTCAHPLRGAEGANGEWDYDVPLLPGDHVTDEAGTGFVHTAPSHGADDYMVGVKHGLPMTHNIGPAGEFREDLPFFGGLHILDRKGKEGKANEAVIQKLIEVGGLAARGRLKHSYPHSWRSKAPLIYRNTPQWFAALDKPIESDDEATKGKTIRHLALRSIDDLVHWAPENRERIKTTRERVSALRAGEVVELPLTNLSGRLLQLSEQHDCRVFLPIVVSDYADKENLYGDPEYRDAFRIHLSHDAFLSAFLHEGRLLVLPSSKEEIERRFSKYSSAERVAENIELGEPYAVTVPDHFGQFVARLTPDRLHLGEGESVGAILVDGSRPNRNRLHRMIETRPDWVLSRQRAWGVPLCCFVKDTGNGEYELLRDPAINQRIVDAFREEGADAWFEDNAKARFLGNDYDHDEWQKVTDILDVWFDSGSTHAYVMRDQSRKWPASMYLEGTDQHRGWFHSSLLEGSATRGRAPYESVLTHGFVLDEKGMKMSKSAGNVTVPQKVIDQYGADILRLWVMQSDYTADLRVGPEILKSTADAYRRLRNTFKYLVSAVEGFTEEERIAPADMPELEQLILHRLAELDGVVRQGYADFEYQKMFANVFQFITVDLSSFYFDIRKDVLYCDAADSPTRRAARSVMDALFERLTVWLAPMLCFTMEEVWLTRHPSDDGSVHLQTIPETPEEWRNEALAEKWAQIRSVRRVVTGALEVQRREKTIGSSLEAAPVVYVSDPAITAALESVDFAELCITSAITLDSGDADANAFRLDDVQGIAVLFEKAEGDKCARCWKVLPDVGSHAQEASCARCNAVLSG